MEKKIAALLRKAEATDNPHEAEAFSKKAEELMLKLGIEEALIRAKMGEDVHAAQIVQKTLEFFGTYSQAQQLAAVAIASGIGTKALVGKTWGRNAKGKFAEGHKVCIIGFDKDVARAIELVSSMQLQCASAQKTWLKQDSTKQEMAWMTAMEKFKARRQFIISFGRTVGRRLEDQRREIVTESTGTDLVLVDQDRKINDWIADEYGRLRERNTRLSGSHTGGFAGTAAGQRASLGGTSVAGGRKELA